MKKILTLLILMLITVSGFSTNYYVATAANGGSDSKNGLSGNPVETFGKVVTLATQPGDVINFGVGTFPFTTVNVAEGVSIIGQGVTTILVSNYVIGRVSGTTAGSINLASATEGSNGNQTLSNFKLIGTGGTNGTIGIVVKRRSNVVIHDVTIYDFEINGITFMGGATEFTLPTIYATGNQIYNCDIRKCGTSNLPYTDWKNGGLLKWAGQDGLLCHDNYLSNVDRAQGQNDNIVSVGYNNKGCKYYNNQSYKPDNDGQVWNFHIESWELQGGYEIYNNRFIGGDCAIDAGGHYANIGSYAYTYSIHDNYFAPNVAYGDNYRPINAITVEGLLQQYVYIYNNKFYKHPVPIVIQGTSWGPSNTHDIYVVKNLFEACGQNNSGAYDNIMYLGAGQSGSVMNNINFINNTITSDITRNAGIKIETAAGVSITTINYKNNIVLNCTNQTFMNVVNNGSIDGLYVQNNLLYGNSNSNLPKFTGNAVTNYSITGNVNSDPLFKTGTLNIQYTSPAKNAGQLITLPLLGQLYYTSTAPDIGFYEYSTAYYVATAANGGDDANSGLSGSPVLTLNRATALAVNPGDSIIFGAGTFTHTTQANIPVEVCIKGVDSTQTIIDCSYSFAVPDFGKASIVLLSSTENTNGHQSITNLKLNGGLTATRAILIRARGNVLIEKVSIQKFFVNGIALYPNSNPYAQPTSRADGNIIRYSQIRNCGDGHTGWTGGSLIDCYGQANTQIIYNKLYNIDRLNHNANILSRLDFSVGVMFKYNDSHKNDVDGSEGWNFHIETWNIQGGCEFAYNNFYGGGIVLDFGGANNTKGTYAFSVKAYNNNFIRATAGDENIGTHAAVHLEATNECSDVFIYNNYIKNFSNALMISDGAPGAVGVKTRLYFFNNLAEDCQWVQSWAMSVVTIDNSESASSNWSDIYILNNTFTGKAGKNVYGINVDAMGTTSNIVIKNNIFYNLTNSLGIANFQNKGTRSNYIVQNNLGYLCGNNNDPTVGGTITGYSYTGQVKKNPLFISSTDYRLQTGSPAIDSGVIVNIPVIGNLPYNNTAPDIGYSEYIFENPAILSTVIINSVNNITSRTANITSTVVLDGGGTVSERGVVYGTSQNPTLSASKVINGSGTGIYITNIKNLSPSTTYYFRAYSINEAGTSYSSQVIVNTSFSSTLNYKGLTLKNNGKTVRN